MTLTNSLALEYSLCKGDWKVSHSYCVLETPPHPEGDLEKADKPSRSRCNNIRYALRTWFSSSRPHPSNLAA